MESRQAEALVRGWRKRSEEELREVGRSKE